MTTTAETIKLHKIPSGDFKLDGGAMFGVVPKSLWTRVYPADENNMIQMTMRCMLVEFGDRKILINNGMGDKQDEKFFGYFFRSGNDRPEKSLEALGIQPEDITDVLLTHLHFDHCGGSIKREGHIRLVPTYPNANYWVSEAQWRWAVNPNKREIASFLPENILPINESGRLRLFGNEAQPIPGIYIRQYGGHTDGQAIPFIKVNDRIVVFVSDLLPTTAHIPTPWVMSYDTRPLMTLEEKELFLIEAADYGYILFLEHDAYTECCTVKKTEKGIKVDKTFTLADFMEGNIEL